MEILAPTAAPNTTEKLTKGQLLQRLTLLISSTSWPQESSINRLEEVSDCQDHHREGPEGLNCSTTMSMPLNCYQQLRKAHTLEQSTQQELLRRQEY